MWFIGNISSDSGKTSWSGGPFLLRPVTLALILRDSIYWAGNSNKWVEFFVCCWEANSGLDCWMLQFQSIWTNEDSDSTTGLSFRWVSKARWESMCGQAWRKRGRRKIVTLSRAEECEHHSLVIWDKREIPFI